MTDHRLFEDLGSELREKSMEGRSTAESKRNQDLFTPDARHAHEGPEPSRSEERGDPARKDSGPPEERTTAPASSSHEWLDQARSQAQESYDERGVDQKWNEVRGAISDSQGIAGAMGAMGAAVEFVGEAAAGTGDGLRSITAEGLGESAENLARQAGLSEAAEAASSIAGEVVEAAIDGAAQIGGTTVTAVGEGTAAVGRSGANLVEAAKELRHGQTVEARERAIDAAFSAKDGVEDVLTEAYKGVVRGLGSAFDGAFEIGRELGEGIAEIRGLTDDEKRERRRNH